MFHLFHGLLISFILFFLGMISLIFKRNLFFTLISLEIMTNSIALLWVILSVFFKQIDGHMMYIIIISISAAEASIGLAFLTFIYRRYKTLDINKLREIIK